VCTHVDACHPCRPRVRAHRLEAPARRRVANEQRDHERDRRAGPEDGTDVQWAFLREVGQARRYLGLREAVCVPQPFGCDDVPDREGHDQWVQLQDPDEDPIDESDEHADTEAGEDRDPEAAVRMVADADDQVPAEEHDARSREVDARMHDDQHLAERRDREHRHVREHEGPGGVLQRRGGDDRGDQQERRGRDPDGDEARSDQGVSEQGPEAAPLMKYDALGATVRAHLLLCS